MDEVICKYRQLRADVDRQVDSLYAIHAQHIRCRQQCTDCCMNLTVWPVEFFAIVEDVRAAGIRPVFDEAALCGFLKDDLCQIYSFRPIICRTHGLPLVYLDDRGDEPRHCVIFCQKNFTAPEADAIEFGPDNTLDMEEANQSLARLHTAYLESGGSAGRDEQGRMALSRLIEFL